MHRPSRELHPPNACEPRKCAIRILTVIAVCFAAAFGIPSAASAADNGAWSVFPTRLDDRPTGRLVFEPQLTPGTVASESVTVTNKTDQQLSFNLFAADAFLTTEGAFSLHRATDPKTDIAAWITLPFDVVTLDPRSHLDIPFTITVPAERITGRSRRRHRRRGNEGDLSRRGRGRCDRVASRRRPGLRARRRPRAAGAGDR